jgi:hypothetical protein
MKKKKSIYIGGEDDEQKETMPKRFDKFLNKRLFFLIVAIVFLLLLALFAGV